VAAGRAAISAPCDAATSARMLSISASWNVASARSSDAALWMFCPTMMIDRDTSWKKV